MTEKRTPAFINNGPPQVRFGSQKDLWGNVPAIDVLQLKSNEGEGYEKELRMLFAGEDMQHFHTLRYTDRGISESFR